MARDGVFFLGSSIAFKHLRDGSSCTVAFSERMLGTGQTLAVLSVDQAGLYMLELGTGVDVDPSTCASLGTGDWYASREPNGSSGIMAIRCTTTTTRQMPPPGIA